MALAADRQRAIPRSHKRGPRHRRAAIWQRLAVRFLGYSPGKRPPAILTVPATPAAVMNVPSALPPHATSPGLPIPPRISAGRVAGLATPLSASPHRHRRTR